MHTNRKCWRRKEQLQQQAGVQLDLEENYREQRDVDQAEQVVDDFSLLAYQMHSNPNSVPMASIHDRS